MKWVRYTTCEEANRGTEAAPEMEQIFTVISHEYSAEAMAVAQQLAYQGEIEIIDDGEPEPAPTQLDRIEAQTTYTAMMTDTLMEG